MRADHANTVFENLQYRYNETTDERLLQNRLYHVNDLVQDGPTMALYGDDIENQGDFILNSDNGTPNDLTDDTRMDEDNNYLYTAIGELKSDRAEDIDEIIWRVDSKIAYIKRTNGSQKDNLGFEYDALGNRIAKHTYLDNTFSLIEKSTYYVRDASGNTMATYEYKTEGCDGPGACYNLTERSIYGSSRLGLDNEVVSMTEANSAENGIYTHTLGAKHYELSNHLGNVLTVITDRKALVAASGNAAAYFGSTIVSVNDYSPFGVGLTGGRSWSGEEGYRYGFNGHEKEKDITGENTHTSAEFWMYDSRLGRRWQLDPKSQIYISDYSCFSNAPIYYQDVLGDKFDPASQSKIDSHKANTKELQNNANNEISKIKDEIAGRGAKGASSNQKLKLDMLNEKVKEYDDAIREIEVMEKSDQMYSVKKIKPNLEGLTGEARLDPTSGSIVMTYVDDSDLAHELKHGYQFETRALSFEAQSGGPGYLYDANDEIEAYQRQFAYNNDFRLRKMTAQDVRSRSEYYKSLKDGPLDASDSIEEVFKGRSKELDQWLNDLSPETKQGSFEINATILGDKIKR